MTRLTTALLALLLLSLPPACRRDTQPPPEHGEKAGRGLVPVRVRGRLDDRSIIGPAARGEEPPRARDDTAGQPARDAVIIDDSTAEGIAHAYAEILSAGRLRQLVDVVVPEQREAMGVVAQAVQPMVDAMSELGRALEARFPGHALQLSPGTGPPGRMKLAAQLTVVDVRVDPDNENQAEATIEEARSSQTLTVALKSVDGRWRVEDSNFKLPRPEELEQARQMLGAFATIADGLQDVTARIESGEIADEQAAEEAVQQAMAQAAEQFGKAMMNAMGKAMAEALAAESKDNSAEEP